MLTTLHEKQKLIDDENWAELSKTDIIFDFNYTSKNWEYIVFEKSFVTDFFMEEKLYRSAFKNRPGVITVYTETIWSNLWERVSKLGIELSTEDWKKVIKKNSLFIDKKIIGKMVFANNLKLDDKNSSFVKALLDDSVYQTVVDSSKNIDLASPVISKPNSTTFLGMSKDEKIRVRDRLSISNILRISPKFYDLTVFEDFGADTDDLVSFIEKERLNPGRVMANMSEDSFEIVIRKKIKSKDLSARNIIGEWLSYYRVNDRAKLSDDYVTLLFNYLNKEVFTTIISNLNIKQIELFEKFIPAQTMAMNEDITIEKISELKGSTVLSDLSETVFFTEEEIIAHPNFFNPEVIGDNIAKLYITQSTFDLLNKTWKRRARYNKYLTDFARIVRSGNIDPKALKYLIKRANPSNSEVVSALSKSYTFSIYNSGGYKRVKQMIGFLKRYNVN